jgi:hypothetical protein
MLDSAPPTAPVPPEQLAVEQAVLSIVTVLLFVNAVIS